MRNQGILAARIMPYSTLIIPLAAILSDLLHRKGEVALNAAVPKIERWYWCSVFSQRYSGQTETVSAKDVVQVLDWIDGAEPPDVVRTFSFRSEYLQEIVSIRNAIYKGVLFCSPGAMLRTLAAAACYLRSCSSIQVRTTTTSSRPMR